MGGGPAARAWARAAAWTSASLGSCSLGGAAAREDGAGTNGGNAVGLPVRTGREVGDSTPRTLGCSKGVAGEPQAAQAQTGSGAGFHGQPPLGIRVVHVCGSMEAAAALLAAERGAAWVPRAGAARPRIAVDVTGRWAALREVGFPGDLV